MSITLDSISLPDDLWWDDETEWTPVDQQTSFSTDGALLVDLGVKLAGRPITLTGTDSTAWMSRETVEALMVAAADPGKEMTLTIRGRTFTVIFSHENGKPIDVEPVVKWWPINAGDFYIVKKISFLAKAETTGP